MLDLKGLADAFVERFNRKDQDGMVELLCEDATAQVIGSSFPEECGRLDISKTSFSYLLADGDSPLEAEVRIILGEILILLRKESGGDLDVIIRILERDGKIVRIEYLVTQYRRAEMVRLVEPLGINVCPPEEN